MHIYLYLRKSHASTSICNAFSKLTGLSQDNPSRVQSPTTRPIGQVMERHSWTGGYLRLAASISTFQCPDHCSAQPHTRRTCVRLNSGRAAVSTWNSTHIKLLVVLVSVISDHKTPTSRPTLTGAVAKEQLKSKACLSLT